MARGRKLESLTIPRLMRCRAAELEDLVGTLNVSVLFSQAILAQRSQEPCRQVSRWID